MPIPAPHSQNIVRTITLGSLLILAAFYSIALPYLAWPHMPWFSVVLFIAPLMVFFYRLKTKPTTRALIVLCLILNLYFLHAAPLSMAENSHQMAAGIIGCLLIIAVFCSATLWARQRNTSMRNQ